MPPTRSFMSVGGGHAPDTQRRLRHRRGHGPLSMNRITSCLWRQGHQLLPELSSQPERGLQTQVELMRLRPLAATTISELGLNTDPEHLLEKVEISAVGQTNVVKITAQAGSADEAAAIANSLAEGFVEYVAPTQGRGKPFRLTERGRDVFRQMTKAVADAIQPCVTATGV